MSTISIEPLLRYSRRETPLCRCRTKMLMPFSLNFSPKLLFNGATTSFCNFKPQHFLTIQASSTDSALLETFKSTDVFFKEIFPLTRTQTVLSFSLPYLFIHIRAIFINTYVYDFTYMPLFMRVFVFGC